MTEAALLKLCDAQARLIQELLDAGQAGSPTVPTADSAVAVCKSTAEALDALRTALLLVGIRKTRPIAVASGEFLPRLLAAMEQLRSQARQSAMPDDDRSKLEAAVGQLREDAIHFLMKWPRADPEQVAESMAAYDRGEHQSLPELLNELRHRAAGTDQAEDPRMELVRPPVR